MDLFARPIVAIVFGAFIVCAETCLHFGSLAARDWLDMPWHDWLAGGWLIAAGVGAHPSPFRLAAPWAFMLSLLLGALFGLAGEWWTGAEVAGDWLPAGAFVSIVIALTTTAFLALVGALRLQRQ